MPHPTYHRAWPRRRRALFEALCDLAYLRGRGTPVRRLQDNGSLYTRLRLEQLEDRAVPDGNPTITSLALLHDTGAPANTGHTTDPTIVGVVTNNGSVAGIGVQVAQNGDEIPNGSATTDANGNFTFAPQGLAFGTDIIQARPWVWDSAHAQQIFGNWVSVNLTFLPAISGLALSNDTGAPANPGYTSDPTVKGAVTNDTGVAVSGIGIEFDQNGDGAPDAEAITDSLGNFTYTPQIPAYGSVTIEARPWAWDATQTQQVFGNWTPISFNYVAPTVAPPQISNLQLARQTGAGSDYGTFDATITGTVTDASGPVVGAVIESTRSDGGGDGDAAVADANGNFSFVPQSLMAGTVSVSVRAKVWDDIRSEFVYGPWRTLDFTYEAPPSAVVSDLQLLDDTGASATDNITTDPTLSGHVTKAGGTDGAGLTVAFDFNGDGVVDETVLTDAHGNFKDTPANLAPGNYTISARYQEWDATQNQYVTSDWLPLSFTLNAATAPTVTQLQLLHNTGSTSNDTTDPTVTGTITSADGVAGREIQFDLNGDGVPDASTTSGSQGNFTYAPDGLMPGPVTVQARAIGWDPYNLQTVEGAWVSLSFTLEPAAPDPPEVVHLHLVNPTSGSGNNVITIDPTVTGQVTNSAGPVPFITVDFDLNADGVPNDYAQTDANGNFTFTPQGLSPGAITLSARAEQWDSVTKGYTDGDWSPLSFTLQSQVTTPPGITGFHLVNDTGGSGQTTDPTVAGQATNPGGSVAYMTVEFDLNGDGVPDDSVVADYQGNFQYTPQGLRDGPITVQARAVEWDPIGSDYIHGNWVSVSFTLEPALTDPGSGVPTADHAFASSVDAAVGVYDSATGGNLTTPGEIDLFIGNYAAAMWQHGSAAENAVPLTGYAAAVPEDQSFGSIFADRSFGNPLDIYSTNKTDTGNTTLDLHGSYVADMFSDGSMFSLDVVIAFNYQYYQTSSTNGDTVTLNQTGTYNFAIHVGGSYSQETSYDGNLTATFNLTESGSYQTTYAETNHYSINEGTFSATGNAPLNGSGADSFAYQETGQINAVPNGAANTASYDHLASGSSYLYGINNGNYTATDPLTTTRGQPNIGASYSGDYNYHEWGSYTKDGNGTTISGQLAIDTNNNVTSTSAASPQYSQSYSDSGTYSYNSGGQSATGSYSLNLYSSFAITAFGFTGGFSADSSGLKVSGGFTLAGSSTYSLGYSDSGSYTNTDSSGTSYGPYSVVLNTSGNIGFNESMSYTASPDNISVDGSYSINESSNLGQTVHLTSHYVTVTTGTSISGVQSLSQTNSDTQALNATGAYHADLNSLWANGTFSQSEATTQGISYQHSGGYTTTASGSINIGGFSVAQNGTSSSTYSQSGSFSTNDSGTTTNGSFSLNQANNTTFGLSQSGTFTNSLNGTTDSGTSSMSQSGTVSNSYGTFGSVSGDVTALHTSGSVAETQASNVTIAYTGTGSHTGSDGTSSYSQSGGGTDIISGSSVGSFSRGGSGPNVTDLTFSKSENKTSNAQYQGSGNGSGAASSATSNTTLATSYSESGTSNTTGSTTSTDSNYQRTESATELSTYSNSGPQSSSGSGASDTGSYSNNGGTNSRSSLSDNGHATITNGTLSSQGTLNQSRSASTTYTATTSDTYSRSYSGYSNGGTATQSQSNTTIADDSQNGSYQRDNSSISYSGNGTLDQTVIASVGNGDVGVSIGSSAGNSVSTAYNIGSSQWSSTTIHDTNSFSVTGNYAGGGISASVAVQNPGSMVPTAGAFNVTGRSASGYSTTNQSTTATSSSSVVATSITNSSRGTSTNVNSQTNTGTTNTSRSDQTNYRQGFDGGSSRSGTFTQDTSATSSLEYLTTTNELFSGPGSNETHTATTVGWDRGNSNSHETNGQFSNVLNAQTGVQTNNTSAHANVVATDLNHSSGQDKDTTYTFANGALNIQATSSGGVTDSNTSLTDIYDYVTGTAGNQKTGNSTTTKSSNSFSSQSSLQSVVGGPNIVTEMNWGGGNPFPWKLAWEALFFPDSVLRQWSMQSQSGTDTQTSNSTEHAQYSSGTGNDSQTGDFNNAATDDQTFKFADGDELMVGGTGGASGTNDRTYQDNGNQTTHHDQSDIGTYTTPTTGKVAIGNSITNDSSDYTGNYKVVTSVDMTNTTSDGTTDHEVDGGETSGRHQKTTTQHTEGPYTETDSAGGQTTEDRTGGSSTLRPFESYSESDKNTRDETIDGPSTGHIHNYLSTSGSYFYSYNYNGSTTYATGGDSTTRFNTSEMQKSNSALQASGEYNNPNNGQYGSSSSNGSTRSLATYQDGGTLAPAGLTDNWSKTSGQGNNYSWQTNDNGTIDSGYSYVTFNPTTTTGSNQPSTGPGILDWIQLGIDIASLFPPLRPLAFASLAISIYRDGTITWTAALGAISGVGALARIGSTALRAGSVASTVLGGVSKVVSAGETAAGLVMGPMAIGSGVSSVGRGLGELANGSVNQGLFDVLRGATDATAGYQGLKSALGTIGTVVGQKLNPTCQNGTECFVEGTQVVVGELNNDQLALLAMWARAEAGEGELEFGPLPVEAAVALDHAQDEATIAQVTDGQRRAMGAIMLAVGMTAGGAWYGVRLRRRAKQVVADEDQQEYSARLDEMLAATEPLAV
jgi:hypothetical protein